MPSRKYVEVVFEVLHQNPEIKLQEFRTSKFISGELKKHGYNVVEGIATTGIIATLDSEVPGPVLGVRADMDALPFVIDGKRVNIHACGHDANSAMVLAMGQHIAEKGISRGKLVTIFQPAEESLKSAYIGLGADLVPGIHRPDMAFDLRALEYGREILKSIVLKRLGEPALCMAVPACSGNLKRKSSPGAKYLTG